MTGLPVAVPALSLDSAAVRRRRILLGAALVAAVWIAGSPDLGAPWILGDEFMFIAADPDVNPAATAGEPRTLAMRVSSIWQRRAQDDLYQPIPLTTYALQWELAGDAPFSFRAVDLFLHAVNVLLVWNVLTLLLQRRPGAAPVPLDVCTWLLALLWALHPVLVAVYAGDMGRTHLLAALFTLLALRFHVRTLATGRQGWFALVILLLIAANLSKVNAGWPLVVMVLEALWHGWRRALRSPRVYVVLAVAAAFAGLALYTSQASGLAQTAGAGLFGDPLARACLAAWYYFRALLLPLWLAHWHPPDPATGWMHPLVWAGLVLTAASIAVAIRAWRAAGTRLITLGWAWWWSVLLPVLGLIGAREAVANDRYLYQPAIGIALLVGVMALQLLEHRPGLRRPLAIGGAVLAAGLLLTDLPQAAISRSTIARARRVVQLYPGDPRALEGLARAYDFASQHPVPPPDLDRVPPERSKDDYYRELWVDALRSAGAVPELDRYFPRASDRGAFHWLLAFRFLRAGEPELSLAQAQAAHRCLPDEYRTWVHLAQAWRAVGDFDAASAAYLEAEARLPADPQTRAVHYTDFGDLLLFDLEQDAEACRRFRSALEIRPVPRLAYVGYALCEIRYGNGETGYRAVSQVLHADPTNVKAAQVLAEYHLRSHNWEQARQVYAALLNDDPTSYTALRGFHEVCLQTGRMEDAALAWQDALNADPDSRVFRSYLVWALALADYDTTARAANDLLAREAGNPFGEYALMLLAVRAADVSAALDHAENALAGAPIPQARATERALAALQLLRTRAALPPVAGLVEAFLWSRSGPAGVPRARALLDELVPQIDSARWETELNRVRSGISDERDTP